MVSNVKKVWKSPAIVWVLMPVSAAAPAVEPDDVAVVAEVTLLLIPQPQASHDFDLIC